MKSKLVVKAGSYSFAYDFKQIADMHDCIIAHLDGKTQASCHIAAPLQKSDVKDLKLSYCYGKVTQSDKRYQVALQLFKTWKQSQLFDHFLMNGLQGTVI